jgi:ABC-type branched-subunit amino acid transport system substrate-binding protein
LAAYDILWTTVMTSLTQKQQPDFESFKAHFIETAGDYYGATGRTELDENGDRKHVFYDFWTIKKENDAYLWQLSAKYNTTDQLLRRF